MTHLALGRRHLLAPLLLSILAVGCGGTTDGDDTDGDGILNGDEGWSDGVNTDGDEWED